MKQLLIGTAQWGQHYGITNITGRLSDSSLSELVDGLKQLGVTCLDTASGYGDAESRIAEFCPDFKVQTKINGSGRSLDNLKDALKSSLEALKTDNLFGALIHDWAALAPAERVLAASFLTKAKTEGLIERVGVSAYGIEDLSFAKEVFESLDVVQIPVNALDQRLNHQSLVHELRSRGCVVQARSVFLQGLLVSEDLVPKSGEFQEVINFRNAAHLQGRTLIEFALDYVKAQDWVDELVVAPTSLSELNAIQRAWTSETTDESVWESLSCKNLDVIDPRRWGVIP